MDEDQFIVRKRCQQYSGPYRCERPGQHADGHLYTVYDPAGAPAGWEQSVRGELFDLQARREDSVFDLNAGHTDHCRCNACK